jgi:hypothetical protein
VLGDDLHKEFKRPVLGKGAKIGWDSTTKPPVQELGIDHCGNCIIELRTSVYFLILINF